MFIIRHYGSAITVKQRSEVSHSAAVYRQHVTDLLDTNLRIFSRYASVPLHRIGVEHCQSLYVTNVAFVMNVHQRGAIEPCLAHGAALPCFQPSHCTE